MSFLPMVILHNETTKLAVLKQHKEGSKLNYIDS